MKHCFLFRSRLEYSNGPKDVEVFETSKDNVILFYYCVIHNTHHLTIMIDENLTWVERNGDESVLSQRLGDLIEKWAA